MPVAQINALASKFRVPYTAGDEISVRPVKEGREHGQAVGYLDDGTMVVVEKAVDQDRGLARHPRHERDPDDDGAHGVRGARARGLDFGLTSRVCDRSAMLRTWNRVRAGLSRSCSPRARVAGSVPRNRRRSCRSAGVRCSPWPSARRQRRRWWERSSWLPRGLGGAGGDVPRGLRCSRAGGDRGRDARHRYALRSTRCRPKRRSWRSTMPRARSPHPTSSRP